MVTRPVIRYYGGKYRLAPWIIEHMPQHRVYVEPYCGASSVLMRKARSYAEIINDLDGEIVNLFRVLRDRGDEFEKKIRLTPFARDEFDLSYVWCEDPLELARRTVVRAYMGFGTSSATKRPTGFRGDSNKSGTTPAHDWANYADAIPGIVERLRGVVIENDLAVAIIKKYDCSDGLFYIDPPYMAETRSKGQFGNYQHEMSNEDHVELLDLLQEVDGRVMISAYSCPLYEEKLKDWQRIEKTTHADGALDRVEVLWLNYEHVQRRLF